MKESLKEAVELAKAMLARADTDVEELRAELEECGIDPDKPLEPQLAELQQELAMATERAEFLRAELEDELTGS